MMFSANCDFFVQFAEMIVSADNLANRDSTLCRQQIWCRQIVSFHFLANLYAPLIFKHTSSAYESAALISSEQF